MYANLLKTFEWFWLKFALLSLLIFWNPILLNKNKIHARMYVIRFGSHLSIEKWPWEAESYLTFLHSFLLAIPVFDWSLCCQILPNVMKIWQSKAFISTPLLLSVKDKFESVSRHANNHSNCHQFWFICRKEKAHIPSSLRGRFALREVGSRPKLLPCHNQAARKPYSKVSGGLYFYCRYFYCDSFIF